MLQQEQPDDYVLAAGEKFVVRSLVEAAACGFKIAWEGEGVAPVGRHEASGRELVWVNSAFLRPAEGNFLIGNREKAECYMLS